MTKSIGFSKLFHFCGCKLWPIVANQGCWNTIPSKDRFKKRGYTRSCGGLELLHFHKT